MGTLPFAPIHCSYALLLFIVSIAAPIECPPTTARVHPIHCSYSLVRHCLLTAYCQSADFQLIREVAPLLKPLLTRGTNEYSTKMTDEYRELLKLIKEVAAFPFTVPEPAQPDPDDEEKGEEIPARASDLSYLRHGHFYPNHPVQRDIPPYHADKNSTSATACNKFVRRHGKAGPGLMMVYCLEHGNLIGFHLMKFSESTRTVHEFLFSRWKEAPALVIYDNGCNFHSFALRREPHFYKYCRVLIDRMHKTGHVACSWAYDMNLFPALRGANSQICEQQNNLYVNKRSQLYYMSQTVFLIHMRHYVYQKVRAEREGIPNL
jgi:hypothetical protein